MIRENPANRGTETSDRQRFLAVLSTLDSTYLISSEPPPNYDPFYWMGRLWFRHTGVHIQGPAAALRRMVRTIVQSPPRTRSPIRPPPQSASEGIGGARGLGNLESALTTESHPEPRAFPVQWADPEVKLASKPVRKLLLAYRQTLAQLKQTKTNTRQQAKLNRHNPRHNPDAATEHVSLLDTLTVVHPHPHACTQWPGKVALQR